jgi:Protein of unknown function (DUF2884)
MNRILILAGTLLVTAALTACSPGINTLGGRITFDSSGMVVHALGHPEAHIGRDGDLSIGGKPIAVTPAQRQLLQQYYRQARDTMNTGKVIGKQGALIATRSIGAAFGSIIHGHSSAADKHLDAASQNLEATADKLCHDVKALGDTQKEIATDIPAFAPYASTTQMHCKVTHTTTVRTNASGGKATTTTILTGNID